MLSPEEHRSGSEFNLGIEAKHFEDPLYARIVREFETNEEHEDLNQAFVAVTSRMSPAELLELANKLTSDMFPAFADENGDSIPIWSTGPYDPEVDESGLVRASIGHIRQVAEYVRYIATEGDILSVALHLEEELASAATKQDGPEFAERVSAAYRREHGRRLEANVSSLVAEDSV